MQEEELVQKFSREKHIQYFFGHLNIVPHHYQTQDLNRMTILYFCVSALDVLGVVESKINEKLKSEIIEWIYSQQHEELGGFRGSPTYAPLSHCECTRSMFLDSSHLASTYTALAILTILGDNLERVNKPKLISCLKNLQQKNGCYLVTQQGSETDIRFVYCAAAICSFINNWEGMNRKLALEYILQSQSTADFAFAHGPHLESHSGSTYCAVNAYYLIQQSLVQDKTMEAVTPLPRERELAEWLLRRQISGFQGRPQKDADTCYSFWIGATLNQIYGNALQYVDREASILFTLSCQFEKIGGICKQPNSFPDVLHSYMGLCGLSLLGFATLRPLYGALGITQRAYATLQNK